MEMMPRCFYSHLKLFVCCVCQVFEVELDAFVMLLEFCNSILLKKRVILINKYKNHIISVTYKIGNVFIP